MTARPSEHNGGPQLVDRTFKKRWAQAIMSRPDKPVGAVAVAFKLYVDSDIYGRGAVATDAEIARATGTSDRSVRNFKAWLVREHFVEVVVRGGRGGKSEFICTLPGENAPAVNRQNLPVKTVIQPALISGKNRLNRQDLPVNEPDQPAGFSGQGETGIQPEAISGKNQQFVDATKERSPRTPLKENNYKQTTVEQDAPRDVAGLNGTKALMVDQLAKWINPMMPDHQTAEGWLTSQVQIYGGPIVKEAYARLQAQIASGDLVAKPIKVLNAICSRLEADAKKRPAAGGMTTKSTAAAIDAA